MNALSASSDLESKLVSFQCARCGECCRQEGFVYLTEAESEAAAGFLGLDPYQFADRFCELEERRRLVLKKHSDETCIFLNEEGCRIYGARPEQCRNFPFRWRTKRSYSYCKGLSALFHRETGEQAEQTL